MSFIRPIALAGLLAALVAGCGGSGGSTSTAPATTQASAAAGGRTPAAFVWLHPGPAPAGWSAGRLDDRATLAYPSSWQRIRSDPHSASEAHRYPHRLIEEYLHATPQQGEETLQNWPTFRPGHNEEEGDGYVQLLASARGLRFRDGPFPA
jgi:hypothetical protein